MKKYEIAISLPVHEKPEIVQDQIININKYVNNTAIILHISKSFLKQFKESNLELPDNVYINNTSLLTGWGNIFLAHVLNFSFAEKIIDFDYFLLQASNDMFIKKGINEYIKKYDAGYNIRKTYPRMSLWWPGHEAQSDPFLILMLKKVNSYEIIGSQVEGSFYKKEIFRKVCSVITETGKNGYINFKNYTKEEVYFPTLARALFPEANVGYPTTFSEVHRFDRTLWSIYLFLVKVLNKERKDFILEDKFFMKLNKYFLGFQWLYKLKIKDIKNILSNRISERLFYINDHPSRCRLYENSQCLFSVKRVKREYNDKIRIYIRNLK